MSNRSTHSIQVPFYRRLWKPIVLSGAGGTAIAFWLEEILLFGEELLALIFLPIMAGVIYLLDILIFRSRKPHYEQPENAHSQGENK